MSRSILLLTDFMNHNMTFTTGTEFRGGGGESPSTAGQGGHNIFVPPIFCDPEHDFYPNNNWKFYVWSWFAWILPAVLCSVFIPMQWLNRTYPRFSDNSPQERRQMNLQINELFHWEINVTLIYAS